MSSPVSIHRAMWAYIVPQILLLSASRNSAIFRDRGIFGVSLPENPAIFDRGIFGVSSSENPEHFMTAGLRSVVIHKSRDDLRPRDIGVSSSEYPLILRDRGIF